MITASQQHHVVKGMSYMLLGTVFFAGADALGKWLMADYPLFQVAWLRSLSGLVLIAAFAVFSGRSAQLKPRKVHWHLIRGVLSCALLLCIFYGLKHLPITEFVAIEFAAPFFIAALSARVLGEKVSKHTWQAIGVGFLGILILLRPTPDHFHIAHLVTLGVALLIALLVLTARLLSRHESAVAMNFYLYPITLLVTSYWAFGAWIAPNTIGWLLFMVHGLISTLALGCFIQSVRYAQPAVVAPVDYARLVWTALLGFFIWNEIPDMFVWTGVALIVSSGIYVVRRGKEIPEVGVVTDAPLRESR